MPANLDIPSSFSPFEPDTEDNLEFFSEEQNREQRKALKSAKTEIRRTDRELRRAVGEEELEAELEPGADGLLSDVPVLGRIGNRAMNEMMTLTEPLFDLLQAGQFATAGAALEYHESGNGFEALRRAGSEFLNALPGIDEDDAESFTGKRPTRASFTDLIRETDNLQLTDNERLNEWIEAAGGFILDVVLDPLTYVGGIGLVKAGSRIGAVGASRGIGLKLTPLASRAIKKITGKEVSEKALPFLSDATADAASVLKDAPGISGARNFLGETFIPHFGVKEFARKAGVEVDDFINAKGQVGTDIHNGLVNIEDMATQLADKLTPAERSLLMVFKDQPKKWEGILDRIAAGDPDKAKFLDEKYKAFTDAFDRHFKEESSAGLMSPTAIRANYAPARFPVTKTGERAFRRSMEALNMTPDRIDVEWSEYLRRLRLSDEVSHVFQRGKKYNTLEERLAAAVPTELDIVNTYVKRSIESTRAIATRKFTDSILSDPSISHLIKDQDLLLTMKKGGNGMTLDEVIADVGDEARGRALFEEAEEFRKRIGDIGLGVWRPLKKVFKEGTEIGELKSGSRFRVGGEQGSEYKVLSKPKGEKHIIAEDMVTKDQFQFDRRVKTEAVSNPAYLLPMPFIKELGVADGIMANNSQGRKFWNGLMNIQNAWKGWAIFSPGFHGRNQMSNVFNNWIGGVRDPRDYGTAFRMQFGDDATLRKMANSVGLGDGSKGRGAATVTAKDGTVYSTSNIMEAAREHGVFGKNLFAQELQIDEEKRMLKALFRGKTKKTRKASKAQLSEALEGEDIAKAVVESAPEKVERDLKDTLSSVFGVSNPMLQANRWFGSLVEDNAKLAHFINRVKKGDSFENAAQHTKRYMFDYGELTDRERNMMKAVIPFYTWMRKNIPLQFQSVLEQPARYGRMTAKPIQAIEQLSEDWESIETPDYFSEISAVRLPKEAALALQTLNKSIDDVFSENGVGLDQAEQGIQPVYLNPNFPFQDLNRLNYKDLLASMSPFIKTMTEQVSGSRGFSIFLDREIERFPGEPSEVSILPGVEKRGRKRTEELFRTALPPFGKVQRLREKAAKGQAASQLLSEFVGIKPIQIDVERVKRGKIYNWREKLRNLKLKYRELGVLD